MPETKITDLVPQETIDQLKTLDSEMQNLCTSYANTARELGKGLQIEVRVVGDLEKLNSLLIDKQREIMQTTEKVSQVLEKRNEVMRQTTNVISRELMEQERVNKATRESYTDTERFKSLLEQVNGSYENRVKRLVETEKAIKVSKAREQELERQLKNNLISQETYTEKMTEQRMKTRELQQEKANLVNHLKNEEKEMQTVEGSYNNLSQRLELMKKAYKDMTEEEKNSSLGREMEYSIQELDAHLKDLAADMGEFQRNVGNYAIAGKDGVVSTESMVAVLQQEARTLQEVSDQTKILEEGKKRLNPEDENYASVLQQVNEQLAQNRQRLTDVSDIMGVQATSVAEAEEQNKRLTEALKNVDQSSDDAAERMAALNAKIEENNRVINGGQEAKESVKKSLKELVLEIANLSIEYQNLTDEEKNSAEGQALAQHIQELTEKAGVLKDAISDTNQAIANAASDTRGFDQLGGTMQLAIDGFGLVKGSAEMLGISTGDLAQIQTKLQAAIAASNAMQTIQNTLQKQSAVMQGVSLAQTKLRTIAENLHTAAQGKGVVATKLLTAAQWAFNAAANANPIGLLVVAITAAIAAIYGLVKAFQFFFDSDEEAKQRYEEHTKAVDEMKAAHERHIEAMKAEGETEAAINAESIKGMQDRVVECEKLLADAAKLYKKDSDEYQEAAERKKQADEDFLRAKENANNYLRKIVHDAELMIREDAIGTYNLKRELVNKELQDQEILLAKMREVGEITYEQYLQMLETLKVANQLKLADIDKQESDANQKKSGGGYKAPKVSKPKVRRSSSRVSSRSSSSRSSGSTTNPAEELKKETQAAEDAQLEIIRDAGQRRLKEERVNYQREHAELVAKYEKAKKTNVKMADEINKQIEALKIKHQQAIEDIELDFQDREISARKSFYEYRLKTAKEGSAEELEILMELENARMSEELNSIRKMERDSEITSSQAEQMREDECEFHEMELLRIQKEYQEKRIQALTEYHATAQQETDDANLKATIAIKNRMEEEMRAADGNAAKINEIQTRYQDEFAAQADQYAIDSAFNALALLEDIMMNEELTDDQRLQYEQELARAKMAVEEAITDAAINEMQRQAQADELLKQKRIANAQQWLDVAGQTCDNLTALMSAVYDNQISKIEQLQEANKAESDDEIARITELVNKKVITEEEGEARKRAIDAETAKKEEELAKKKAALQKKQAIFDKANSIAQASIATALAITQAMPNFILAAIAAAMGAAQIATIIATPLPQYKEGTPYHKGGLAIVGDGGQQEVVMHRGMAWLTPDTPTLVDLPRGASVLPSVEELAGLANIPLLNPNVQSQQPYKVYDDKGVRREIANLASLIRQHSRQQHADAYRQRYELFKSRI